jgi:hypothetical protein
MQESGQPCLGPGIGIARSPEVAIGYLGVAAILFACHKYAQVAPSVAHIAHGPASAAE